MRIWNMRRLCRSVGVLMSTENRVSGEVVHDLLHLGDKFSSSREASFPLAFMIFTGIHILVLMGSDSRAR